MRRPVLLLVVVVAACSPGSSEALDQQTTSTAAATIGSPQVSQRSVPSTSTTESAITATTQATPTTIRSPRCRSADSTGDSNNTSSFVCRAAVNSGSWSRHAHGGAIDINPFHNPYVKGELVIPELASAYLDREREVPGMVTPEIEAMFGDLDWGWGGNWNSASDWMHFSDTGT